MEFKRPGSFEPVTGYRGGGPHGLNAGEWTDDTSMALALADSIKRAWDLNDQMQRYLAWRDRGEYSANGRCFDIGNTTNRALEHFKQHGDARRSGSPRESDSGNGSIMRLAPVAIKYRDSSDLMHFAAESSLTTHASPHCISACRYLAVVLAGLINGESRETVLGWRPAGLHPAIEDVALGSYRRNSKTKGSGYVVDRRLVRAQ